MLSLGLSLSAPATQQKRLAGSEPALLSLITPSTVIAPATPIQGT